MCIIYLAVKIHEFKKQKNLRNDYIVLRILQCYLCKQNSWTHEHKNTGILFKSSLSFNGFKFRSWILQEMLKKLLFLFFIDSLLNPSQIRWLLRSTILHWKAKIKLLNITEFRVFSSYSFSFFLCSVYFSDSAKKLSSMEWKHNKR